MTEKTIYAIELDDIVVWDWEKERDAIYLSLYEAKQEKHKIWWYYREFCWNEKCKIQRF